MTSSFSNYKSVISHCSVSYAIVSQTGRSRVAAREPAKRKMPSTLYILGRNPLPLRIGTYVFEYRIHCTITR